MNSKDLIKMVEDAGWYQVRCKGSHHQFKHPDYAHLLTIPHPKKDFPTGTLNQILKQAGLK